MGSTASVMTSVGSLEAGPHRPRAVTLLAIAVWAVAITAGMVMLTRYTQGSGRIAAPPSAAEAGIAVAPEGYTLVMAVHPKCPCTDASLYELERLMTAARGRLSCVFVVMTPPGNPGSWLEEAEAEILTRGLAGAADGGPAIADPVIADPVIADPGGVLAGRLGSLTSGSVVLYDPAGAPLFWGGITPGRGHAGDNIGSDAVRAILAGRPPRHATGPVYGCPVESGAGSRACGADRCGDRR